MAIRTPDQRLRVFVSSTLGELAAERRAVSRAIGALRLTPVLFELGARPHPPRELYRAYLEQSDVFIGLYWQRYGWVGPGMQVSGLEEEFDLARGLPQLLYIKTPAPDREPQLTSLLDRIRAEGAATYRAFSTPAELARLVRDDLAMLLSERFAGRAPEPPPSVREPRPLPASTTSLVGREHDVDEVVSLAERPEVRLVTLTGPGGIGKTRLAVAAAQRLRDHFPGGTAFVPLGAVSDPGLLLASIGQAVGSDLTGTRSPAEGLAEQLGDEQWLLILDNLEQLVSAAADLGELLVRGAGLEFLVTSRTVLGLGAEREYPVPPLPLPLDPASASVGELAAAPAVELFVDRARRVRPDFALTPDNAGAVAGICRRLDGVPLAIELAAARTRLLDPGALLGRLARSMDALGTGPVDMPERQRTLRATVEWSVGLLDDSERSLLEIVAIFADGWTIDAAARVAGLEEDEALELTEALARHSLIQLDHTDLGPRCRMLETVREFISERLANRADADLIARRHAGFYRALADQADRPLRAAQAETVERLDAEAGNVAVAVRWHLAHDPAALPHLFRVLWPFWFLRGHPDEALVRQRVEQLLPIASSLGRQAEEELLWTAGVSAADLGDDQAAQAIRQRLEPLLPEIRDPFLSAVAELFMAWSTPITGDLEQALHEASACLDKLRGQDEPFFTSVAEFTASTIETALGRYDQALRHLSESRVLADESGIRGLVAGTRVQLGILHVLQGKSDEARPELAEALNLSLAARSTPWTALSLAGHARLALATGDARRAARLAGAAQGLRRRFGLQAWPMLRRSEAELVAQVRRALGAEQFDQAFADGSGLSQREAVAAARADPAAAVLPAAGNREIGLARLSIGYSSGMAWATGPGRQRRGSVGGRAHNAGMNLDGMTALITGGADGIGGGIAKRLAAEGMHVVIADLSREAGEAMARRTGGSFVHADAATSAGARAAVQAATRQAGRLGVVVLSAGGVEGPGFPAADPAAWERTLDLNLRAVMLTTQLALAPMAEGGGGAIITVASVAGLGTTSHDKPEYAAAKAGVMRFTACLAPLRDTIGVRANCICPGLVDTPASRRSRAQMTPAEVAGLPPVLTPADMAQTAMDILANETLAGRIMVCRGGQPNHLLPLVDWQTALAP